MPTSPPRGRATATTMTTTPGGPAPPHRLAGRHSGTPRPATWWTRWDASSGTPSEPRPRSWPRTVPSTSTATCSRSPTPSAGSPSGRSTIFSAVRGSNRSSTREQSASSWTPAVPRSNAATPGRRSPSLPSTRCAARAVAGHGTEPHCLPTLRQAVIYGDDRAESGLTPRPRGRRKPARPPLSDL